MNYRASGKWWWLVMMKLGYKNRECDHIEVGRKGGELFIRLTDSATSEAARTLMDECERCGFEICRPLYVMYKAPIEHIKNLQDAHPYPSTRRSEVRRELVSGSVAVYC